MEILLSQEDVQGIAVQQDAHHNHQQAGYHPDGAGVFLYALKLPEQDSGKESTQ